MDTEDMLCPKIDLEMYLKDILPTTVSLVPLPKKASVFAQCLGARRKASLTCKQRTVRANA